jgi:ABC-type transport system involved in cytochrome c biogenesis ATPase subunit
MISQKDIEKALDFLRDSAETAAVNRSNRVYMEEFRKSLKAQLMSENLDMAVNAQEREAYKNVEYITHLEAMKEAIYQDEKLRFLIEAAKIKISAWQTMEKANANV